MLSQSKLQIIGVPGIVSAVTAAQKVGVEAHSETLASVRGLRQAQAERGWGNGQHTKAHVFSRRMLSSKCAVLFSASFLGECRCRRLAFKESSLLNWSKQRPVPNDFANICEEYIKPVLVFNG